MTLTKCSRCKGTGTIDKPMNGVSSDRRDAAAGWDICPVCDGKGEYEYDPELIKELITQATAYVSVRTYHDGERWQTWAIDLSDDLESPDHKYQFWGYAETKEDAQRIHAQTVGWFDGSYQEDDGDE